MSHVRLRHWNEFLDAPTGYVTSSLRLMICLFTLALAAAQVPISRHEQDTLVTWILIYLVWTSAVWIMNMALSCDSNVNLRARYIDIAFCSVLLLQDDETFIIPVLFYLFTVGTTLFEHGAGKAIRAALAICFVQLAACLLFALDGSAADPARDFILLRTATFLLMGSALAFLGSAFARRQERLIELVVTQGATPLESEEAAVRPKLDGAAFLLCAPKVVAIWAHDEAVGFVASLSNKVCGIERYQNASDVPGLMRQLEDRASHMFAPNAGLHDRSSLDHCISAPFRVGSSYGWLFAASTRNQPGDATLLALIAKQLGDDLTRLGNTRKLVAAAVLCERKQTARDLHDGILQNLTATRLRLASCAKKARGSLAEGLSEIQTMLLDDQIRLRVLVETRRTSQDTRNFNLDAQARALLEKLGRRWHCGVDLDVMPRDATVPAPVGSDLLMILAEALANSAQHGHASRVNVQIRLEAEQLSIRFSDNGCGAGEAAAASVPGRHEIQPASIRERVAALNGKLFIEKRSPGLSLSIEFPVHA
ncbi:MAG: sensor histidine kinase [Hyphomicrobiales bacterium]|nr:sensor histidine kinase [Hyphomicrobiales bacterium]